MKNALADTIRVYEGGFTMNKSDKKYQQFVTTIKEEIVPAMGCTEPIAIAYATAQARKALGEMPDRVVLNVSGNIIKNVKSVIVPHTGGLRGIPAAAAAGIVGGEADAALEVISSMKQEQIDQVAIFMESAKFEVHYAKTEYIFDIGVELYKGNHSSRVRIVDSHTNIIQIEKDGEVVFHKDYKRVEGQIGPDRSYLSVADIIEFADIVDLDEVRTTLDTQINYNMAISAEGLQNSYGANVGSTIMKHCDTLQGRAKAATAAGSDARMSGCELPVMINSGSGNQGMTCSIPVIVYARELGMSHDELLRALVVSNLITTHLKTGIGRLSAYCGAISAGVGAGAGIAYLYGGRLLEISHTIVNGLAIISGTICDGAKASCAAKIAAAVDAGLLGYYMYAEGQEFLGGDGLVVKGVEQTIENFGKLASIGMSGTDKEIIQLMVGEA